MRWKELGAALREARERRLLSQDDLAVLSNTSKATISRAEALTDDLDANHTPRLDTLERIVLALGVGPLGPFLHRFEEAVTSPVTAALETALHGPAANLAVPRLTPEEAQTIQRLGLILVGAATAALAAADDAADADESPVGAAHAGRC